MELFATCAFGLEKLVYDELKKLGLWVIKTEDGRVSFNGDEMALIRANIWSRCAERIHIKIAEFEARTFDQLFDHVYAFEWEKYIGPNDAFPVAGSSVKSVLHSEPAIQSIVKKAVVKRLQVAHKTQTLPENSGITCQVMLKANKDRFVVSINTTGDSLHKRGYRTQSVLAPIKETLAAAMIKLSDWTPAKSLVDLFCGSGTIAIEAAMIAQNIAPGMNRSFAFEKWPWISEQKVMEGRAEAKRAIKTLEKLPIYSFDIDADAVKIAEQNAKRAGVSHLNFKRADFMELDFSKFKNCTFICNPPYGERLEEIPEVRAMYGEFGKQYVKSENSSLYLITSDEQFPAIFSDFSGRMPEKNRKLFNGAIRCYLFQYMAK